MNCENRNSIRSKPTTNAEEKEPALRASPAWSVSARLNVSIRSWAVFVRAASRPGTNDKPAGPARWSSKRRRWAPSVVSSHSPRTRWY